MSRTTKVLALSIGEGINLVLGFLLVPYLARAMSLEDNGTYGQVILITATLIKLLGFGFNKILFADLANEKKHQPSTIISNLSIVACFGLVGVLVLLLGHSYIATYFHNPVLRSLLLIYCLAIPFSLIQSSLNATLIYFGLVTPTVKVSVLTNMLRLALIFVFIQLYYSLTLIFVVLLIIPIIQCLGLYFFLPKKLLEGGRAEKSIIKGQINNGIPLGLTVMISTVFYSLDGFMVSRELGVEDYALFRNGAIQIPVIASLYGAVNTIVLPDITKMYAKGNIDQIAALKKKSLHNTAGLIYPLVIFFVVFSFILIPMYLSEKYALSYMVFSIVNLTLLFRITSYDDVYIASNNNKLLPRKYFIAMLMNLVLNYVFIILFGFNGAALATLLSFIILIYLLINGSLKILSVPLGKIVSLKKLFFTIALPLLLAAFLVLIYKFIEIPIVLIVFFIIYVVFVYHIFIKKDIIEKNILRFVLKKYTGNVSYTSRFFNKIYGE